MQLHVHSMLIEHREQKLRIKTDKVDEQDLHSNYWGARRVTLPKSHADLHSNYRSSEIELNQVKLIISKNTIGSNPSTHLHGENQNLDISGD